MELSTFEQVCKRPCYAWTFTCVEMGTSYGLQNARNVPRFFMSAPLASHIFAEAEKNEKST